MTDTVYHVTTPERAERCLVEGIIPYKTTLCHPNTLAQDQLYDQQRPKHISHVGLSRLGSVYAHPDLDDAPTRQNGGWLQRVQGNIAILAIQIPDSSNVYVGDGVLVGQPYSPPEFWASITTLQHYREQLRPTFRAPSQTDRNLRHPEKWRNYLYMWPEVLIPGGVQADDVSLVAIVDKSHHKSSI